MDFPIPAKSFANSTLFTTYLNGTANEAICAQDLVFNLVGGVPVQMDSVSVLTIEIGTYANTIDYKQDNINVLNDLLNPQRR